MKNEIITINRETIDKIAAEYFSNICGFNRDKEKFKAMLDVGLSVRDIISERINVRAVMSSFGKEAVCGKTVNLDGTVFECNALEQINNHSIYKIYVYILTVGNIELKDASDLDAFYADTWGTAYVDAARDVLRTMIGKDSRNNNSTVDRVFVSDSFGPGFYGMDVTEVRHFFYVLDGEKIGVQVTKSGFMLPQKSITGFFIVVDDEGQLPGTDCKSCFSNVKGCHFCRVKTNVKSV